MTTRPTYRHAHIQTDDPTYIQADVHSDSTDIQTDVHTCVHSDRSTNIRDRETYRFRLVWAVQEAFDGGSVDATPELIVCRLLLGDAVAAYHISEAAAPGVQGLIEASTRSCTSLGCAWSPAAVQDRKL